METNEKSDCAAMNNLHPAAEKQQAEDLTTSSACMAIAFDDRRIPQAKGFFNATLCEAEIISHQIHE